MRGPKVTELWIGANGVNGEMELRADFDNDRRHAVTILRPGGTEELAHALVLMAENIIRDPYLNDT